MNAARSSGWTPDRSTSPDCSTSEYSGPGGSRPSGQSDAQRAGGRLDWDREGTNWPNRESSSFVQAGGLSWHVQRMGQGPVLVLAHGTGASTHSWRAFAPELAKNFAVISMDLPGHGFTQASTQDRFSLPGMAGALAELLAALDVRPEFAIGHSAGAAVLSRMCLDRSIAPHELVSLNGAFIPFRGVPGQIFAPLAKLLATSSLVPRFFAWNARDPAVIDRLLRSTGSTIDPEGVALYRLLARDPGHLGAALQMMANWDLATLLRDLPRLPVPLSLVVGTKDGTVAPSEAHRVRAALPTASFHAAQGLGHLAHEERPAELAGLMLKIWRQRIAS